MPSSIRTRREIANAIRERIEMLHKEAKRLEKVAENIESGYLHGVFADNAMRIRLYDKPSEYGRARDRARLLKK